MNADAYIDEGGESINPAVSDEKICVECKKKSYAVITYHASAGRVQVPLCLSCGEAWWKKWGGTAIGHSASVRDPQ